MASPNSPGPAHVLKTSFHSSRELSNPYYCSRALEIRIETLRPPIDGECPPGFVWAMFEQLVRVVKKWKHFPLIGHAFQGPSSTTWRASNRRHWKNKITLSWTLVSFDFDLLPARFFLPRAPRSVSTTIGRQYQERHLKTR